MIKGDSDFLADATQAAMPPYTLVLEKPSSPVQEMSSWATMASRHTLEWRASGSKMLKLMVIALW